MLAIGHYEPVHDRSNHVRNGNMAERKSAADGRPFDILGIDEAEERVYRQLLAHPGASRSELGAQLAMPSRALQRLLDAIEAKGLATHSPERPRRYIPAAPDMAIQSLILKRQDDLQRARLAARELQEQVVARHPAAPEHIVELIASSEAERLVYEQMHLGARQEIITLMRPPMRISSLHAPYDHSLQQQAHARGVRFRTIVDAEFLALDGSVGLLRSEIGVGTVARTIPHLPFKMVLADRRIAIIPLNLAEPSSHVLLLRSSALLDALYALFEILWSGGAPIVFPAQGESVRNTPGNPLADATTELVPLLAAGLNDKAIAHELGISARTFERRMVAMMKSLGARTRFQAGWLSALQLEAPGEATPAADRPRARRAR